ncbi:outer membrane beta-barrel protein [Candidatus Thiothrix sp. Deng01]|uniref:Outer membrane beta-barrel protein n=1 Tax=Candidatus Thiothrix phosphatis TaxID=3112415 RepID=A0ABU6D1T3_9GAMM|nr:outer membrane beta-barrel protein [Candidatus Thiothrix sp. Deng01]MEB4593023.1 outer membrane beta-barrel protein [Candidatus Thiothrix sp. Deng01]
MKKSILFAAMLAAFTSSSVFAGGGSLFGGSSEEGAGTMYGGASIGKTSDGTCNSVKDEAGALLGNIDCPTPSGWKVFGGYKVTPNLAVEGAYVDFGDGGSSGIIPVIAGVNNVANGASISTQATGFNVSGVASTAATDEISLFGKAGLMAWNKDTTATVQQVGVKNATVTQESSTDGVDLSLGAGAEYKINDNWGVRGEVEHFDGLNANLYSVGATFSTF